jgi:hypothetical protein
MPRAVFAASSDKASLFYEESTTIIRSKRREKLITKKITKQTINDIAYS